VRFFFGKKCQSHFNTMFSLETVFHQFSTKGSALNNSNSFFGGWLLIMLHQKTGKNYQFHSFKPCPPQNLFKFSGIYHHWGMLGLTSNFVSLGDWPAWKSTDKIIEGIMPLKWTQPQNHALLLSSIWIMVYLIMAHVWKCMVLVLELCWSAAGFLLRISWCTQSGDHPENNLAKFGYIIDMKIAQNNKIFLYSWLPSGSYYKTLEIWNFFNSKSGKFGLFFFPWKVLCISQNQPWVALIQSCMSSMCLCYLILSFLANFLIKGLWVCKHWISWLNL
jgi:hypothetical protein